MLRVYTLGIHTVSATMNAALAGYRGSLHARIFRYMKTNLWNIDSTHTTVGFGVRHVMVTTVRGVFEKVAGTVRYDEAAPEATEIHVEIPVASVSTRDPQRDGHLRSADFFDAERHPLMTFDSTNVRATGAESLEVTGNLTLRGVTREVVLTVRDLAAVPGDFNGNPRRGASATATVKRSEFGIVFNKVLEAGGVAIADEVSLRLDISLVKA